MTNPRFTQRHYIVLARVIKDVRASLYRDFPDAALSIIAISRIHARLADEFKEDNEKFDPVLFERAIFS